MSIEFGELPQAQGGPKPSQKWAEVAAKLRANPGNWARIETTATVSAGASLANAIRTGKRLAFLPAGDFEATLRGQDVWARYVGAES